MSWFGIHVKGLRKLAGMTKQQLAQRIGVGITTIENIESGYVIAPPLPIVEKISKTFDVTVEELIKSQPIENAAERAKEVYVINEECNDASLPAWNDVEDVIYVDRDVLRGHNHIAVKVSDSSMDLAGIVNNSIVLVRLNAPVKNGDVVLAEYEDKRIVRKYFTDGKNILLRAVSNTENYPDIRLDAAEHRSNIVGKVIRVEIRLEN